jgi:ketosteroid isomerase-like protein
MTTQRSGDDAVEADLFAMEARRCRAMLAADIVSLREILHPDLIHVHAKGQIDGYDSYFATGGFKVDYKTLDRGELQVRVLGDSALMTGRQLLVGVRKDGSGTVRIDSRVMQTWIRDAGRWRQLAFQTTPLEMSIG